MLKKIRFLAYDTANGIKMEKYKEEFKRNSKTEEIQKKIDDIRSRKPDELRQIDEKIAKNRVERISSVNTYDIQAYDMEYQGLIKEKCDLNDKQEIKKYRNDIHIWKEKRQLLWVDALMNEVKNNFDDAIKKTEALSVNNQVDTYVLMLPEFFWADISDGVRYYDPEKNGTEILGYTAPLYDSVYDKLLGNNALTEWMRQQRKKILFFAGTAMHKKIQSDPSEEKIFNTLVILEKELDENNGFKGSVLPRQWNKINYSWVDGFNLTNNNHTKILWQVRGKDPHNDKKIDNMTDKPFLKYNGVSYSYDICLDYCKKGCSVSKKLLIEQKPIFNILIAGGMEAMTGSIDGKSAKYVVRCDKYPFNETCCSVRIGADTYAEMKYISDSYIRYIDFEIDTRNNSVSLL